MDEKTLIYEFRGFRLDVKNQRLTQAEKEIPLTPKSYQTLLLLVQSSGRVLEKEDLIKVLWPDSFVEEGNLSQNIFILRKALGDDGNGSRLIETIPRRGYKFVAPVTQIGAATSQNDNGQESGSTSSSLPTDYWNHHSPFRGLQVFEPEDAWLFFGRDSDTQELLIRLARTFVLVIIGNSGSGKSSLIRAGLIPALRHGQFHWTGEPIQSWHIALVRPSSSPFDYLAEILPSALAPELSLTEQIEFIASCRQSLSSSADALRNAICALERNGMENSGRIGVLLVVDQFEELFTLCTSQDIRQRYISSLLTASKFDGPVPVYLVLVLRADFYANCLDHPELSRCLESNVYNLQRMTEDQLREAIERRLALAGAQAEPGLISSLLVEVGTEPGNLALLEYALSQLWEKCRSDKILTNQAYAEIGRLRGALGKHADEVYGGLDDNKKSLAQKIFLELVHLGEGGQDTRRRVKKSELISLGNPDELEQLLSFLVSRRLISITSENRETSIEVSHEALIREWSTLREWISRNRDELRLERRLIQAAEEWHMFGKDQGALLQGAKLSQAEVWFAGHQDAPALLQEFLQASAEFRSEETVRQFRAQQKALSQQRTAAVRLRWFSCILAVMLLVALGSAWFAHKQKTLAESRALAAQSEELLSRDHGRALDLAIKSWQLARTEEAHLAVAKAFAEPLWILKHDAPVMTVKFSPDGRWILTASEDHTAKIWRSDNGQLLTTLRGHTDKIWQAAFSSDGQRILTASSDHTARVWDGTNGNLLATLKGHTHVVLHAAFSPDGKKIVTASSDHTGRLWDSVSGKLVNILQGHMDQVVWVAFSPDGKQIVTASFDGSARVWDSADGRSITVFRGHSGPLICAVFFPDSQRIITGSWDGTAKVWNSITGHLLMTLQHNGPVGYVAFSSSGDRIITASKDRTAHVWNSSDGRLLFTLSHDGQVDYAEFSRDDARILTASTDHTARVWSGTDGHLLAVLQHDGPLKDAGFSPDGRRILTASDDHTARVWNTTAGWTVNILRGHTAYLLDSSISPDGQQIITTSYDHTARVWNASDGRLVTALNAHTGAVTSAAFSPDGEHIVTASEDHTAKVWNNSDGRLLFTLQGHTDIVWSATFSPRGEHIATSDDHHTKMWSSADGHLLFTLPGHIASYWGAAFSPNGKCIVTSEKYSTKVWNTANGDLLLTLEDHTHGYPIAAFSPDGEHIFTSDGRTAKVWDSADGQFLRTLDHGDYLGRFGFSSDGRRIVITNSGNTARVWDSTDGHLLYTLIGHTDAVVDAQFSPDGKHIITGGRDGTARIWSSTDGALLATLQGHSGQVRHVEFSPDGESILTISLDQTARIWHVLTLDDIARILVQYNDSVLPK